MVVVEKWSENRERDTNEKRFERERERERESKKNTLPVVIAALNPAPEVGFSNDQSGLNWFPQVLVVVAQAADVVGLGTSDS